MTTRKYAIAWAKGRTGHTLLPWLALRLWPAVPIFWRNEAYGFISLGMKAT